MALLELQNQQVYAYQSENRLKELETYLNQLLQIENVLFSPALRAVFQFDTPYHGTHERPSKFMRSGISEYKKAGSSGDSEAQPIFDTEGLERTTGAPGKFDDYFDAVKNPFHSDSLVADNKSFFVQGEITQQQRNDKASYGGKEGERTDSNMMAG